MSEFARSLRALIENSGLSQNQFAELCGVPSNTISQYATGLRVPGWEAVCKMADALGVSVSEFRCEKPKGGKARNRRVRVRVEVEGHPEVSIDVTKTLLLKPAA